MKKLLSCMAALVVTFALLCGAGCTPDSPEPEPPQVILVSIAITHAPDKVTYQAGETFDKTGMVVTARYNDNTSKTVEDYTVDKTVLREGDTSVIVTYQNKRAVQEITVVKNEDPDTFTDLLIPEGGGTFRVEAEDLMGEGNGYLIDSNAPPAPWTSGSKAVGYMKKGDPTGDETVKFRFETKDELLVAIEPLMAFYGAFDWAGLNVTLDGETVTPSGALGHAAVCPDDGDLRLHWQNWIAADFGVHRLAAGRHTLVITTLVAAAPGIDCIDVIAVPADAEDSVRSIYFASHAAKLVYEEGEAFETQGMAVKARHLKGEDTDVPAGELSVTPVSLSMDTAFVTVTYKGKTVREPVIVTEEKHITEPDVTLSKTEKVHLEAEDLQCIDGTLLKAIVPGDPSPEKQSLLSGEWVDYLPVDCPLTIYLHADEQITFRLTAQMGRWHGYSFGDGNMTISLDGEEQQLTIADIPATEHFHDPEFVAIGTFTVEEGDHTITFVNHYKDAANGVGIDWFEFIPEGAVETYTVTYSLGYEGEAPASCEKAQGDSFELPDPGPREGWTFEGWSDGQQTYGKGASYTMPAHPVLFTALWERVEDPVFTPDATLSGELKLEAENLGCINGDTIKTMTPADATDEGKAKFSGEWIDYIAKGTEIIIKLHVEKAGTYAFGAQMGFHHDFPTKTGLEIYLNDAKQDLSGATELVWTDGKFHEPQDIFFCNLTLEEGDYTIRIVNVQDGNGDGCKGPGFDFFTFREE